MSDVLVISPDYASHYLPMGAVASEMAGRGLDVVVASGPGIRSRVEDDGFTHMELVLGAGSNPGVIRAEDQVDHERQRLDGFFAASRRGMTATLMYQAQHRLEDLLWEPERVSARIALILKRVRPRFVIVDQLAFGATAALRGLGQPFVAFHPGHPSAMSTETPYGYPPRIPHRLDPDPGELRRLRALCSEVAHEFTRRYNEVVRSLDPAATPVADAFVATSGLLALVNYPDSIGRTYRLADAARFIGASVHHHRLEGPCGRDASASRPFVYISLGSFFSARTDILGRLVSAFRHDAVDVALATGVTAPSDLPAVPDHWIVDTYLPQPALIARSDLVVTHGGNNTVTESLLSGVPMLVGPLSTDQFSGAADIEAAGMGAVFDPNNDPPDTISDLALEVLSGEAGRRTDHMGMSLRANSGPRLAVDLIESA